MLLLGLYTITQRKYSITKMLAGCKPKWGKDKHWRHWWLKLKASGCITQNWTFSCCSTLRLIEWHFQHCISILCNAVNVRCCTKMHCTALDWIAFFAMLRATTVQISDGLLDKQRRLIWTESVHKTGPHHLFEVTVMHWQVESEGIFHFKFLVAKKIDQKVTTATHGKSESLKNTYSGQIWLLESVQIWHTCTSVTCYRRISFTYKYKYRHKYTKTNTYRCKSDTFQS